MEKNKFVLGIKQHPYLSHVAVPMLIDNCKDIFCKIKAIILPYDLKLYKLNEVEQEIVNLAFKYSDENLYKKFSKKNIPITDFFSSVEDKYWEVIFQYVDKYQKQVLDLAIEHNIEIYLKPHRFENIYSEDKITICKAPSEAVFNFERNGQGTKYYLTVKNLNKNINLYGKEPIFIVNSPCYMILDGKLMFFKDIDRKKLEPFLNKQFINVPKSLEPKYYDTFIKKAIKNYHTSVKGFDVKEIIPEKKAKLYVSHDFLNNVIFTPKFLYNNKEYFYSPEREKHIFFDNDNFVFTYFYSDPDWEKGLINVLENLGLKFVNNKFFRLNLLGGSKLQNSEAIAFLNTHYKDFTEAGFEIVNNLNKDYYFGEITLELKAEKKIDWFDIYAKVKVGDVELPFYQLKEYILNNIREIKLPDGKVLVIPDIWFKRYKKILLFGKKVKDKIRLNKGHLFALNDDEIKVLKIPGAEEIRQLVSESKKIPQLPQRLKATLRPYQLQGYAWLNALRKYNFGGCLIDDMGLGKTVQAIAVMLKSMEEVEHLTENQLVTNLIVVPKSLLHNWENELRQFVENPKILIYAGNDRGKLIKYIPQSEFVLISYGLLRNDIEKLVDFNFNYIVLDESHYIKNPYSKIYKAVNAINARHKLVLTGTPIENSLRDLWTQMNFVNKDLLGSLKFFQENFLTPIEKNNDTEAKAELKRIITPFLLRRTKEEVFDDLPELDQQTIICEMSDDQALLYESEKSKIRNELLEVYKQGKLKRSSVLILQAMTRLRQIANHPNLVISDKKFTSGKFDEILLRLESLINHKHKILIFSSFVKFLHLLEDAIKERGWRYKIMTGDSTNRKEIISDFQSNDEINLFLLSLKVGGVGLNLTAADYVFILDPWWNPQAELQAISRAHRLGQSKNVFVQRFITYGTIEEKIQQLQQKKLALSDEFINSNNLFKFFSEEKILELFK